MTENDEPSHWNLTKNSNRRRLNCELDQNADEYDQNTKILLNITTTTNMNG